MNSNCPFRLRKKFCLVLSEKWLKDRTYRCPKRAHTIAQPVINVTLLQVSTVLTRLGEGLPSPGLVTNGRWLGFWFAWSHGFGTLTDSRNACFYFGDNRGEVLSDVLTNWRMQIGSLFFLGTWHCFSRAPPYIMLMTMHVDPTSPYVPPSQRGHLGCRVNRLASLDCILNLLSSLRACLCEMGIMPDYWSKIRQWCKVITSLV